MDTVTSMTLEVCEASSSWLEVIHSGDEAIAERAAAQMLLQGTPERPAAARAALQKEGVRYLVQIAGMKNITEPEIDLIMAAGGDSVRDTVIAERKPIVADDLAGDPRFRHLRKSGLTHGSLVVVPLVSHSTMIGILYATKEAKYGFVKDDVDLISTFADQATIAIENSRLIKKSIDRDRLFREMLVAQEMQKKLLPQAVPNARSFEIEAVSTPAFEVGGDYYDLWNSQKTGWESLLVMCLARVSLLPSICH